MTYSKKSKVNLITTEMVYTSNNPIHLKIVKTNEFRISERFTIRKRLRMVFLVISSLIALAYSGGAVIVGLKMWTLKFLT